MRRSAPLLISLLVMSMTTGSQIFRPLTVYAAPRSDDTSAELHVGDPRSREFNERGVALAQEKKFPEAEEAFRRALEIDPKNLTAAFNLAGMLITNKQEQQAVALLEPLAVEAATDPGLFARLGDAYFGTKQPSKALTAYNKALELDPNYPGLHPKRATIFTMANKLADAEQALLAAVEENPRDAQSLANLSAVFLANRKADKAVSTAKRALQVQPSKEVYVTLGTAYEAQGDLKNALIAFQRARDLGDTRPEVTRKIEALQKVTG